MADLKRPSFTDEEALAFHARRQARQDRDHADQADGDAARSVRSPIRPAWPCPCAPSRSDPDAAYDYTAKGNLVAVISNGTAILGLGDLGALASKPVMEGKAVLFKRFADVDSIDLEVDTKDVDAFINCGALSRAQPSAASIWKTSRRRTASSSRSACAS